MHVLTLVNLIIQTLLFMYTIFLIICFVTTFIVLVIINSKIKSKFETLVKFLNNEYYYMTVSYIISELNQNDPT